MKIRFVAKSRNSKTGPIAVTTTEEKSCPPSCPLKFVVVDGVKKLGPCYANYGPTAQRWHEVNSFSENWSDVMDQIATLPANDLWRHNQAGDLPGDGELIDKPKLRQLVRSNRGKRGFTYSHKHSYAKQRTQIRWANENGFTVNLSADNLDHADKLADFEVGPVCVTLPYDFKGTKTDTPQGRAVRVCPAQYKDTNCKDCGLCQKQNRKVIVGFISHGPAKRRLGL